MALAGVSMHEVAAYLGHSVARTTELYAHHHPDFMHAARAALRTDRKHYVGIPSVQPRTGIADAPLSD